VCGHVVGGGGAEAWGEGSDTDGAHTHDAHTRPAAHPSGVWEVGAPAQVDERPVAIDGREAPVRDLARDDAHSGQGGAGTHTYTTQAHTSTQDV
jgi:hypothetical protein